MTLDEIFNILNEISPFELQESWDNSGLNLGNTKNNIENVYTSLECDLGVINEIAKTKKPSLLITHHPLIFKQVKNLHLESYPANLLALLIKYDISLISLHTNFDKTHLNDYFVSLMELQKINFSYKKLESFSIIFEGNDYLENIALHIKKSLNLSFIRYSNMNLNIKRLLITCGSNGSALNLAKANDCVITGDLKYHDVMIAHSKNIGFIEISHFDSEKIFPNIIQKLLKQYNIKAKILNSHNPFKVSLN